MSSDILDTVIVGCGPAGLAAGIYAARYQLAHAVIGEDTGGTMLYADLVENYPGHAAITGKALMEAFTSQAAALGVNIIGGTVASLARDGDALVARAGVREVRARTAIIATGSERRKLGVQGEEEYAGCGVSYCATCDAPFFKNKTVCIVGGSDSAAKEALVLSRAAKQVHVIYRKSRLRAEPMLASKVYACGNIDVIHDATVASIDGNGDMVTGVTLHDGRVLPASGVFIEVGFTPRSGIGRDAGVDVNDAGEIIVDKDGRTSVPGIFAAGDVTDSSLKQAITAAGDGARACWAAVQHLQATRPGWACGLPRS